MGSVEGYLPAFAHDQPAKYTEPPVPGWTYGEKVDATPEGREWLAGEKAGWKVIEADKAEPSKLYAIMVSGIIPRPIAFVSSISEEGVENLAPFSWFNMVTYAPPLISISAIHQAGGLKDTARNIISTKQFTVNMISHPFVANANITSVDVPPEVSEWPLSGLTKAPSLNVKPARVRESGFSLECELFSSTEITDPASGKPTATLILGLVKTLHVRNDVLNERGMVDPVKLNAVARMGDITYARQGDVFRQPRPSWTVNGEEIKEALKGLQ